MKTSEKIHQLYKHLHLTKKRGILIGGVVIMIAACVTAGCIISSNDTDSRDVKAKAVSMEKTLTAAGEIKAAKAEVVDFSTSRTYKGMCVEENESVSKGQHLIAYTDGTYTDAPAKGIVTDISAPEQGNVATSSNYVTIGCTSKVALEITLPEDEINDVSKGDKASVIVNSDTSSEYTGTITGITAMSQSQLEAITSTSSEDEDSTDSDTTESTSSGSQGIDQMQGSSSSGSSYYSVTITMKNTGNLSLGMSASSTITISSRESVLAVPIEAVYFDKNDKPYVYKIDGSSEAKTSVETGESDANYVEITKGLAKGDTVRIKE